MIDDATYEDLRARLAQDFNSYFAPSTLGDTVASINGWKKSVMGDGSFGRIFNGPQWLDRVAIRDGAINAAKVTSTFVIANTFTTADTTVTPTADRMEMTASGLSAYGTVSSIANTQTLNIANNGNFTFGTGSGAITYVASTGTLTVPAASIGSLTIANVGGGVLGGAYKTATGTGARLEFDTAGIRAYNSSNTKTFDVVASSGALDLTGTLTVGSGGKIKFGSGGADYLDNNILHFEVGTGEEAVLEWKNSSNTPYGYVSGYASSTDSYAGLVAYKSATASSYMATRTSSTLAAMTQLSTWDSTHNATFVSTATASSASAYLQSTSNSLVSAVTINGDDTAANNNVTISVAGRTIATLNYANRNIQMYGRLYPGPDTGSPQTTDYIDYGTTGVSGIRVNSNFVIPGLLQYTVTSGGTSGALPSPTKYITISAGAGPTPYFIPVFTAVNAWTA